MNYKPDPAPIHLQLQPILPIIVAAILVLGALFSNMSFVTNMLRENVGLGYALSWLSGILRVHADDLDVPGESEENVIGQSSRDSFRLVRRHSKSQPMEFKHKQYYPGLVNVSGTYCFMNSVLQAFASLSYLQPHIEDVHSKAVAFDVPTPVTDAIRDILKLLNTPSGYRTSHRPTKMINALSTSKDGKHILFSSREHQDAQELFQLLSSLMKDESVAVDREACRGQGLGLAPRADPFDSASSPLGVGKSVFDGLTANRRSCMVCGYTEAVMHFSFDNLQLALPFASSITLQECLADLVSMEILNDCTCRKCSLMMTYDSLKHEVERGAKGEGAESNNMVHSRKKVRELWRLQSHLQAALAEGRVEEEIKGLKVERVLSRASKQAMIARSPQVLVLHLNRSAYYGSAAKNPCCVQFPEFLDVTPFTTTGQLSIIPSAPISSHRLGFTSLGCHRSLYRLSATVCHYGAHSFGHYVAYRRKPTSGSSSTLQPLSLLGTVNSWLRISDDLVDEVGIDFVLSETSGTFLLFYERIIPGSTLLSDNSDNEVKNELISDSSLQSNAHPPPPSSHITPRIVRSFSVGSMDSSSRHVLPSIS